jgi:hypothetical protein
MLAELLETARTPHLFTAEDYAKLEIDARTELLGGLIYDVSPRNEPHRHAVRRLARILNRGLGEEFIVQAQDAVAVPDWKGADAPEVDVAVLRHIRFRPGPTSSDAVAFVEISDATYTADRRYKIPLYVRAGVPSWILNIPLRQLEYYGSIADLEAPHGRVSHEGDLVEIAGVIVRVSDLFESEADAAK